MVTDFVAKSHPEPRYTSSASFSAVAKTKDECLKVVARALRLSAATGMNNSAGDLCDNGGLHWHCDDSGGSASVSCSAYESDPAKLKAQLQPALDWAKNQGGTINATLSGGISWNASEFFKTYDPRNPSFPWMERHPDRQV